MLKSRVLAGLCGLSPFRGFYTTLRLGLSLAVATKTNSVTRHGTALDVHPASMFPIQAQLSLRAHRVQLDSTRVPLGPTWVLLGGSSC